MTRITNMTRATGQSIRTANRAWFIWEMSTKDQHKYLSKVSRNIFKILRAGYPPEGLWTGRLRNGGIAKHLPEFAFYGWIMQDFDKAPLRISFRVRKTLYKHPPTSEKMYKASPIGDVLIKFDMPKVLVDLLNRPKGRKLTYEDFDK